MENEKLLKQITILDFMAIDLHLYLNTHPNDNEALSMYNDVISNADKLRCVYEKKYGPLCSYRSAGKEGWSWMDTPWPWSEKFNFELC